MEAHRGVGWVDGAADKHVGAQERRHGGVEADKEDEVADLRGDVLRAVAHLVAQAKEEADEEVDAGRDDGEEQHRIEVGDLCDDGLHVPDLAAEHAAPVRLVEGGVDLRVAAQGDRVLRELLLHVVGEAERDAQRVLEDEAAQERGDDAGDEDGAPKTRHAPTRLSFMTRKPRPTMRRPRPRSPIMNPKKSGKKIAKTKVGSISLYRGVEKSPTNHRRGACRRRC